MTEIGINVGLGGALMAFSGVCGFTTSLRVGAGSASESGESLQSISSSTESRDPFGEVPRLGVRVGVMV